MRRTSRPGVRLVAASVLAVWAMGSAAPAARQSTQTPVFRTAVDRVAVDIVAVASNGLPVPDLKAGDLALKVDGKLREIRSLEFVRLVSASPPPPSALPPAQAVPPPFGSNAPSEAGRVIILVFHHTSLRPGDERAAKTAAAGFINKLRPRDRIALMTYQEGGILVDLTTNHARVLKALSGVAGHAPAPGDFIPAAGAAAARNEAAFAVKNLVGLMNSFAAIDGPKTVVFVSAGLPGLSGGASAFRAMDRAYEYQDVGRAAAKARVQLYILQAHSLGGMDVTVNHPIVSDGLSNNGPDSSVQDGLQEFAGVTGGTVFHVSASGGPAFERVDLESSAYYLLSFDAETRERDGKIHKITVSTSRSNIIVRARPEFLIAKAGVAASSPLKTQARTLLKDLSAYRDLQLRSVAYTFRATAGKAAVIVATDSDPGVKIASAAYALIDEKGKIVAQWDADATDLATTPTVSAAMSPPGMYRLRVAAVADDGRMGAVDYEFQAGLTHVGPLSFGGLMLGQLLDNRFRPQIDFTDESSAAVYVEVYGVPSPGEKATVTIELATTVDGPALVTVPAEISSTKDADRWIATADLPLTAVASGDHVVRAVTRMGEASGTVVRTLRKRYSPRRSSFSK